ncbi:MAG: putative quinol monooxygenase [Faecalibacterium sp.]
MIKIVAKGKIKDGKLEEVIKAATPLVAGSRGEKGNLSYSLNQSIKNPNEICFIEFWIDQRAIDIHNETEHFKTGVSQLGSLLDGGLSIELYKEIV